MKPTLHWSDGVSLGGIVVTAAATAVLYAQLPAAFPTHFGLDGHINGTTPKPVGPWLMPALSFILWLVLRFSAVIFPGEWRERLSKSPVAASAAVLVMLLCGVQAVSLYGGLHPEASMNAPILVGLGVFMLALGQFYPRLRRNPF